MPPVVKHIDCCVMIIIAYFMAARVIEVAMGGRGGMGEVRG